MLNIAKLAVIAAFAALLAAPSFADDKAVATVNGVAIPQSRLDEQMQILAKQGQPDTPEVRKAILDRIINFDLMAEKAVKEGYDKKPEIKDELDIMRKTVLIKAMVKDYQENHPISEDKIHAEYDKVKDKPFNLEYNLSAIVVATEKEAKSIVAKLKKGGNMKALAKKYTRDPGAKKRGGEMGWFTFRDLARMRMQPIGAEMVTLKKGEVGRPIQTPMGWYIIKVNNTRQQKYEDVKNDLLNSMQESAVEKMADDLRKNAKVEINLK